MTRPILASIDLQALKQNLTITRQAAPDARVWSVVKATHMDTALNASGMRWAQPMVLPCSILKRR